MRKLILGVIAICFIGTIKAQNSIKINTEASVVKWKGENLFNFNKHNGTVQFKSGQIYTSGKEIVGGEFVVDMNTIVNTDGGRPSRSLIEHLKNQDFFHVEKFPLAKLKITKVRKINPNTLEITADLTIKGQTNSIVYRTNYQIKDKNIRMESKFIIDRTRWGINYKSRSIFATFKDNIISDAIKFEVIVATSLVPLPKC